MAETVDLVEQPLPPVSFQELLKKSNISGFSGKDISVTGLAYDSRKVKKGDVFFAIKGLHADGHDFLAEISKKGAVAAVVENEAACPIPSVKVPSVLAAMSRISKFFFNHPSGRIPVVGITGTNGKTTTTYLIEDGAAAIGKTCGVMGTVNYRIGREEWPAPNTTPMSLDVQEFLYRAVQAKAHGVAMEVSSHALELQRVDDVEYAVRVFTNLTQDHLDFHKSMENYYAAKAKLFKRPEKGKAVINIDDSYGQRLAGEVGDALTYGFDKSAALRASEAQCNLQGVLFRMNFPSGRSVPIRTNLLGRHNIYNCLSAAGALLALGFSDQQVSDGLSKNHAVPGRLERVEMGQPFVVAVDYAHTDDALGQVLKTLRDTGPKRLVCVFGAGGDRDKTKRPKMGAVAVKLSDFVYVTSDNPRTERPVEIMKDIEAGIRETGKDNYTMIEDRAEAIEKAIKGSTKGDIVLIAGKGHEDYQIIGTKKNHFSDFEEAQKALASWN